ncbi:hypothetical protein FKR81_23450 [Lentzea tibetensis]|uniref:Uncharacterized protein n=1 Tax=Lentzea tibetensis TaxID=2591470 RepID=A0A563EQ22_9PSEU|nr:hypothetical protein [Lentzea tibetensis]TWP49504.1 hypothetical protein FKR81_23450 [Lentzea tibetensis]
MGLWSHLNVRRIECPKCHTISDHCVQFFFGGCNDDHLEIGHTLSWGPDGRGEPGHRLVVTDGLGSPCPGCGGPHAPPAVHTPNQFDIFIENDVITHARWATGEFDYDTKDEPDPESDYLVLDDYPPSVTR